ncbi:glycosyltransferase [Couchioplanes caeruleus]|uniref:PegA polyene extending glycosyltransferase n=3 Tax=Couchioplanes caeruleus TaxID=56438 RepID=A0A1K0GDD0_9ACTN|nr:glycosyltransferase [Couchioplanes caeruleus]OJF15242.1 PegA polyene extending glycosyltransferase [Couchioplanes caeruleus subsp. caeruleus]ROP28409.1 polyene glycosyltransferase [Couchioplanes caeruleus]
MTSHRPILFCCTHSTGQATSSLVLAGEFAARGVKNLWFASDDNHRAAVAGLSGASEVGFVSTGPVNPRVAPTMWDDETYRSITQRSRWKGNRARLRQLMDPVHHADRFRQLDAAVQRIQPALMVINNLCIHGIQVAMKRGVPYVITGSSLASDIWQFDLPDDYPVPYSGLPRRMNLRQRIGNRLFRHRNLLSMLDPALLRTVGAMLKATDELGLDRRQLQQRAWMEEAELVLCFSVFGLDYPFPHPPKLQMVGAMVPPLPQNPVPGETDRWLDAHPSVVFIAFGTITRLTKAEVRAVVDVARRLGERHHVLWKLPREQQRFLPPAAELPANLRVEDWLPSQYDVLAHSNVRVFFGHGGNNSFHEGIYFGKPSLVRPLWFDCLDHAVRAVDSGVGLSVAPGTMDPAEIHSKLTALLDDTSFRARAEHFAQIQHEAGGVRRAADLILRCAAVTSAGQDEQPAVQR